MRETKFIEQNRENWERFEAILKSSRREPDQLSDQFIRIINDLSYARTFYPNRSVRVYLNNLAQKVFYSIYKNKKEKRNRFMKFWVTELPSVSYRKRGDLLLSLVVFLFSVAIGVLSSINDAEFARVILGDTYVNMTIENIESDDPMAVYKSMNGIDMFLQITFNNLMVAFRTFVMGIFMAIGTIAIMVYNGIMVGTFQYFFIERGLFWDSFLTIWLHGTLEISSIVIAGAAGIVLGKGLVFPGTYPRLQSLQISAAQGLKLFIGIAPILVIAAIIESFMTRFTEAPEVLKGALIFMSLLFILFYFVWYPRQLARKGTLMEESKPELSPKIPFTIQAEDRIKTMGEIFKDVFGYYKQHLKKILTLGVAMGLIFTITAIFLANNVIATGTIFYLVESIPYFDYSFQPLMFLNNMLFLGLVIHFSLQMLMASLSHQSLRWRDLLRSIWSAKCSSSMATGLLISAVFWLPTVLMILVLVGIAPLLIQTVFISYYEDRSLFGSWERCWETFSTNAWKIYGLFACLVFLTVLFVVLVESPLIDFYQEVIGWNFDLDQATTSKVVQYVDSFKFIFSIGITIPILISGLGIQYFSLKEILEANYINKLIKKFRGAA